MSGTSYTTTCPECEEKTLLCYSDYKPHDIVSGYCVNCGFYYNTIDGKLSKKELIELQKEESYNPKTKQFKE